MNQTDLPVTNRTYLRSYDIRLDYSLLISAYRPQSHFTEKSILSIYISKYCMSEYITELFKAELQCEELQKNYMLK
jgi:hypothetical protein